MNKGAKKLVMSALFAALSCMMTMIIQIPAPTGYVNLGDCAVLLGAWVLGPVWGGAAAAVGSSLADVLNGWASYAPATFAVKFAMAAVAACVFRGTAQREHRHWGMAVSGLLAELMMAGGYYMYESLILGVGAAAVASVPANLVQGLVCFVAAVAAAVLLDRGGVLKRLHGN